MKKRTKYKNSIPLDNSRTYYDFRYENNNFIINKRKTPNCKKQDAIFKSKDLSLAKTIEDNTDLEKNVMFNQLKVDISKVLSTLAPREERVLRLRFGINTNKEHTLEEIGSQLNLSRDRIRQIEAKALRKMKHPSKSENLKTYLEN